MSWACQAVIGHSFFEFASFVLISSNSIFLALEDPTKERQSPFLEQVAADQQSSDVFLYIYSVEMVLKILALGFVWPRGAYLRDPWNILDFCIIVTGYLPLFLSNIGSIKLNGLRSLRVLRPLKTVTTIKKLRSLILTIFEAIPYLIEIMVVLIFVFLIFSIAGLQLFSGLLQNTCIEAATGKPFISDRSPHGWVMCTRNSCPTGEALAKTGYSSLICAKDNENPNFNVTKFDDLLSSFLMVYVVTTLEGWSSIMSYVQRTFDYSLFLYFFLIVFIGAFFLLNLTLAVISIKFNESQDTAKTEEMLRQQHSSLRSGRQPRLLPRVP